MNKDGDLFDQTRAAEGATSSPRGPLAFRMRPRSLAEFEGQTRILGPGKPLRHWIETDRVPSLIFWGPPGCGKTTLARIISESTHSHFVTLSAVLSGVKEIREAVEEAGETRKYRGIRTFLFVDEIHRFNQGQQDALLPHVEDGTVTLLGATTENPSFELNRALLSRARVIRLERHEPGPLESLLRRALVDPERGLAGLLRLSDEAISWLAVTSEGDARRALTSLETVALFGGTGGDAPLSLSETQAALESALERQPLPHDKRGDEHHAVVSALIKSIRDSDPHAGLYYLARLIEAGEDPLFIARRLVILASEDVGNADPRALQVALAAKDAVDFIGMPEGRIPLAQAVTYLAAAPKSNAAYLGIGEASAEVQKSGALPVPMHLRNAFTALMRAEGFGAGYRYAHDQKEGRARQTHLPAELLGRRFYRPKPVGLEKQILEKLSQIESDFDG